MRHKHKERERERAIDSLTLDRTGYVVLNNKEVPSLCLCDVVRSNRIHSIELTLGE